MRMLRTAGKKSANGRDRRGGGGSSLRWKYSENSPFNVCIFSIFAFVKRKAIVEVSAATAKTKKRSRASGTVSIIHRERSYRLSLKRLLLYRSHSYRLSRKIVLSYLRFYVISKLTKGRSQWDCAM